MSNLLPDGCGSSSCPVSRAKGGQLNNGPCRCKRILEQMNTTNEPLAINYDDASPLTREVCEMYEFSVDKDGDYENDDLLIIFNSNDVFSELYYYEDFGESVSIPIKTNGQFHHLMAALGIQPKGSK